jgi:hypothetical protein
MYINGLAKAAKCAIDVAKPQLEQLANLLNGESEMMQKLRCDFADQDENKGQIMKAIQNADWFAKWGKNHILQFTRAHQLQVCTNFKD